jgi:hypothetical protein
MRKSNQVAVTLRVTAILLILLVLFAASCTPSAPELAHFTENDVEVSIRLEKAGSGYILSATFTPPKGFHLYSKDIPRGGVDGLGRPTLLELPEDAQMRPTSPLAESVPAEIPPFEPKDLLVYPAGPVTLSLPVTLPEAKGTFEDTVSITYMTCSNTGCKPPVVGKLVKVKVSTK